MPLKRFSVFNMELIIKAAAAAVTAAAVGLLIKKSNPEISFALGTGVTVIIAAASLGFLKVIRELADTVNNICGCGDMLIQPVLKCLAVAAVSKISAELCRDSSQAAAAYALELAGGICAAGIAMPLILSVLKMIGGFL